MKLTSDLDVKCSRHILTLSASVLGVVVRAYLFGCLFNDVVSSSG